MRNKGRKRERLASLPLVLAQDGARLGDVELDQAVDEVLLAPYTPAVDHQPALLGKGHGRIWRRV
jgi:hypothetical protein